MAEDCAVVICLSDPIEAFLTALFRCLEVFGCSHVLVLTTRSRERDAVLLIDAARSLLPSWVEVGVKPVFPEPTDLSSLEGLVEGLWRLVRDLGRRVVIATFSGSRLEVSSTVLAASRAREDVVLVYTPFFWGPWSGLFYPFTPKPLEPVAILHPDAETVLRAFPHVSPSAPVQERGEGLLNTLGGGASQLRRLIARSQLRLNTSYATSSVVHPVDMRCCGLKISLYINGAERASVEIRDYCSYGEVIDAVDGLGQQVLDLSQAPLSEEVRRSVELLAKFSSILLLTAEECTFSCGDPRGLLLIDFLATLQRNEGVLVDTNVIYSSLHTQLYEYRAALEVPLCAYVELLRHRTHYREGYGELRSAVAQLAIDEIKALALPMNHTASQEPCEVGIALANRAAITCDHTAYTQLFQTLGARAVLAAPRSLKQVRFARREDARRAAYAYYAVAQLRAIASHREVQRILSGMRIRVEYEQRLGV
ncbi:MAG: hypothetical protein RMI45_05140 [Ignisphaera sp.]|nr:hypothetical protein [Ignisphaera sp.]MDW8085604.1 hypothetical protein [Ignisphaera sp.]